MVSTHKFSDVVADKTAFSVEETAKLLKLHRVLVPLDGVERSEIALPYALLFSRWLATEINLFHIIERGSSDVQSVEIVEYSDLDHDRGVQLATAYLEEVAAKLKGHRANVRFGVSSGDMAPALVDRAAIMDIGMAMVTLTKEKNLPFIADSFFRTVWGNMSTPLLCLNGLIASKLDVGIKLTQPTHFVIWAHNVEVLKNVLIWARLLHKLTQATFTVVVPLRHVRFPTFVGSITPKFGMELDQAVADIEAFGTHVDVIFAPDEVAIGKVLQKINPFSWNITASQMLSYNLRTFAYNILRENVPHQLLLQSTVPVLVVPFEKTRERRQNKYTKAQRLSLERLRRPFNT